MVRSAILLIAFAAACASAPGAGVTTGTVAAPDGVQIAYDVRGAGSTALVFVHCWSCDRTFWKNQVDVFSDRYKVVTLDLGGHGKSGKTRQKWAVLGLAKDVQAVADKLELKRMILVGHSMGGPVSLEAARLLRGRVIGVIAVDTLHNAEARMTPAMVEPIAAKLKADFPGTMSDVMGSMFADGADPKVREWVETRAKAANPETAVDLMLDFANLDMKKLFSEAGVPIRAINAQRPGAPTTETESNRKYADFDAILIDNVGHFVQLEKPREFNAALEKWAAGMAK